LEITPDDKTYYGDSLAVSITSNVVPFFYHIDGGDVIEVSRTDTTFSITGDIPEPGGEISRIVRAFVEEQEAVTGDLEVSHEFIRRRLSNPNITPASGDYVGDVRVSMAHPVSDVFIHYSDGAVPTRRDSEYAGDFSVTPDTTLTAQAFFDPALVEKSGAGGWLASDTSRVDYRRVARPGRAAYFDRTADGRIDSAAIYVDEIFDELTLPNEIHIEIPVTGQEIIVADPEKMSLHEDGGFLGVVIDGVEDLMTGFSPGVYLTVRGDRYEDVETVVSDSIAPVILRAAYYSGEYIDGERNDDTLGITFSEPVYSLSEEYPLDDSLFYFGGGEDAYTGDFTYLRRGESDSSYFFSVSNLEMREYPYRNDSVWINTECAVDVADDEENVQDNPENRRVPMSVERMNIRVRLDAFWLQNNPAFRRVSAYEDFGDLLAGHSFDVSLGGLIIIDPQISFGPGQVQSGPFDAELIIFDAVGNVVTSVSGREDTKDNIQVVPLHMNLSEGRQRYVLAVAWDGTNDRGRQVHSRSYKIIANTVWPDINGAIGVRGIIPVLQKY
jgi:hypothetical protein